MITFYLGPVLIGGGLMTILFSLEVENISSPNPQTNQTMKNNILPAKKYYPGVLSAAQSQ